MTVNTILHNNMTTGKKTYLLLRKARDEEFYTKTFLQFIVQLSLLVLFKVLNLRHHYMFLVYE